MAPAAGKQPVTTCHVVAVPYPGRGHVNPMMNLCKLLVNYKPDLLITVVLTEEWIGFIGSEEKPPSIRFVTIPNVLPSERERAADMPSFVGATQTKMGKPFEQLMERLGEPVHFIITDMFLFWAVEFGNRRNIPVASLWAMPASVFSVFYHFDLLERHGHHPFELSGRSNPLFKSNYMAAAATNDPIKATHMVAVPYPGRGHINPMMNLCKLLANSKPYLLITFVVTEEWLGFIGSEEKPPSIRLATIPNVLPPELDRANDMPSFVGATQTKMGEPFEQLMDRLGEPIHFVIADTFLFWAVEFGNRRNIPVASLWPMPASVFAVFYHFNLLDRYGHYPFELSERGEERIDYVPGIGSIRLADIPSIAQTKDQRLLRLALNVFNHVSKAQYLLISSIYELESQTIQALKQEFSCPIYTFGPAIPFLNLEKFTSFSTTQSDHQHYFEWLNSQPPSSVLYVSLGSFLSVSNAQMDEIADGLRISGVSFLWVARGEAKRLQQRCGDAGRVVPWCEQLKVLCHPSVCGFWTHCGWNSTMECIFAGVPMICFPLMMDQMTVRKHVVEDWKIGLDAKKDLAPGQLLRSGAIVEIVEKFMDLKSVERGELVRRASEFREAARKAVSDGGSSITNLTSLVNDIVSFS